MKETQTEHKKFISRSAVGAFNAKLSIQGEFSSKRMIGNTK